MDLAADLRLLTDVAREAGELAMTWFRCDLDHWEKSPNNPVSEADLAVNELVKARLRPARPDYGWLSEESDDDGARLDAETLFVVDPIDGTRAFIAQLPHFAVSLAVVRNHEPVAGVVYNPAEDLLYAAAKGMGATCNGKPISVGGREDFAGASMLNVADFFRSKKVWPEPWPEMSHEKFNSIAWRIALVAAGTYDACVTLRPKCDWDLAAADIILWEAGGVLLADDGRPPRYNKLFPEHPYVIAANKILAADALRRVDAAKEHWKG